MIQSKLIESRYEYPLGNKEGILRCLSFFLRSLPTEMEKFKPLFDDEIKLNLSHQVDVLLDKVTNFPTVYLRILNIQKCRLPTFSTQQEQHQLKIRCNFITATMLKTKL